MAARPREVRLRKAPRPAVALAAVLFAAAGGLAADPARALTLDFESFVHGDVVTGSGGVSIVTSNLQKSFDLGVAFDTTLTGTADPDLEGPPPTNWGGGNLPADAVLGRVLIVQENDVGCGDGRCDVPDDEGGRPAGTFDFLLPGSALAFGFDIVDVEGTIEIGSVTFFDSAGASAGVAFADLTDPTSAFFDPTVVFGDHTANRIAPFTAAALGLGDIARVRIVLGGSGAVDNVEVTAPEPGAAGLLAVASLAGLALARRHSRPGVHPTLAGRSSAFSVRSPPAACGLGGSLRARLRRASG